VEPFVRNFIRSSLAWLGVGVLLGTSMAFWPMAATVYRPAHAHANLLGFVSMMIFGVAYHVIPRFSGSALHSRRLAAAQLWVSNIGLGLLVGGWIVRVHASAAGFLAVRAGAVLSAVGAMFFIYNVWRTMDRAVMARTGGRLPVKAGSRG